MGIDIQNWELIESKTEKLKNRWDHEFEWKERSFNIKESNHILMQGSGRPDWLLQ